MENNNKLFGICGSSGSGKSFIVKYVLENLGSDNVSVIYQDNYYKKRDSEADVGSETIQPSGLFKELRDVMPKNSSVTLDAGTLCLQATDQFNFAESKSLFTPLDFGLVGFSFAAGLGCLLYTSDAADE